MAKKVPHNVLYLSTFPPRECGIATFTQDLVNAISKRFNLVINLGIVGVKDEDTDTYDYGSRVVHQITASNLESYVKVANDINNNEEIKLIHIQHEFGIFGGEYGANLFAFLKTIKKPIIITFHTVLPEPNKELLRSVQFIVKKVNAVIVMNELSKKILEEAYQVIDSKISVIHHGIPQTNFSNGDKEKKRLGFEGKLVLSTFGMLSEGKGIEYTIRALPEVVKRFDNLVYLIIGATHPVIQSREGENYRNFLISEVKRLGLENKVKFYNRYMSLEEIICYLKATDIYVCSALDQSQSVSGTLSYALGCGRPVISTFSSYAKNFITPDIGVLVEFKNAEAITNALLDLLTKEDEREQMARNAYIKSRHMTWNNVALSHFNLYQKYANFSQNEKLPPLTLQHLRTLTDSFGIIQFADHIRPDKFSGYCIDDNARALLVAGMHWSYIKNKRTLELLNTYLRFIERVQRPNGSFTNFVASKNLVDDIGFDEDAQGRTIWSLGYLISQRTLPASIRRQSEDIFIKAIPMLDKLESPRAIAFCMIGLYFYNKAHKNYPYEEIFNRLGEIQKQRYLDIAYQDWSWFEEGLTYSNSKLPESFFYAYLASKDKAYLDIAIQSLDFLIDITFDDDIFSPIGQDGWYFRNAKRAYFDQQPEEVSSMVQTLLVAYEVTKNKKYKELAFHAFQWFMGKNHLNQAVYDELTGGCYDGLGKDSLNINQGAESTISYLLARLALEEHIKV